MKTNAGGEVAWTHVRRLYRDWGSLKTVLKAFALAIAICFALVVGLVACAGGMTLKDFGMWCKIWGVILLGFEAMALVCYFIWAWANGGVDEWEYEMDDFGIHGAKVVHNPGRMKFLRSFAWILMLAPGRPSQKMAMRGLLYDNTQKTIDVPFSGVREVSGDEAKGKVVFQTSGDPVEIGVPSEDYAEIFAYVSERVQAPKQKKRGGGRRRKADSQVANSDEKKGARE